LNTREVNRGVPLISETLWPLALMASMLLICTAKD